MRILITSPCGPRALGDVFFMPEVKKETACSLDGMRSLSWKQVGWTCSKNKRREAAPDAGSRAVSGSREKFPFSFRFLSRWYGRLSILGFNNKRRNQNK